MADITPAIPAGRQLIDAYGDGGFRIGGVAHKGSILVFAERVVPWPVAASDDATPDTLAAIAAAEPPVELLLLGTGGAARPAPAALRLWLREIGAALEVMDTGAACRTYNVLMAEDRRIAAALIALD